MSKYLRYLGVARFLFYAKWVPSGFGTLLVLCNSYARNYPMITPEACLKELHELSLDREQKELFLYKNAERVFDL